MVEPDAGVPHGVPEGVGDGGDLRPALVDQDEVEIAVGRELAAPEAADGDQRHPVGAGLRRGAAPLLLGRWGAGDRIGEQTAQPRVERLDALGPGQAGQCRQVEHESPSMEPSG